MSVTKWHLTEHFTATAGPSPAPGDPPNPEIFAYRFQPPGATDPMVLVATTKAELLALTPGRGTIGHAADDVNAAYLYTGASWRRWTLGAV